MFPQMVGGNGFQRRLLVLNGFWMVFNGCSMLWFLKLLDSSFEFLVGGWFFQPFQKHVPSTGKLKTSPNGSGLEKNLVSKSTTQVFSMPKLHLNDMKLKPHFSGKTHLPKFSDIAGDGTRAVKGRGR